MTRIAVLIANSALAAAPAAAATYSARPLTAPTNAKIIGKDISWACGATGCTGSTDSSRPLVICQDLAKRAGRLGSFTADGRALDAAELDKCNAKAAGGAATELAHAN
jgi:hypothetical protein